MAIITKEEAEKDYYPYPTHCALCGIKLEYPFIYTVCVDDMALHPRCAESIATLLQADIKELITTTK